jgi:hypothetical protein
MLCSVTKLQVHSFSVGYLAMSSDSGENGSVDFEDKIFTKNKSLYNIKIISGATSSLIGKIAKIKTTRKRIGR